MFTRPLSSCGPTGRWPQWLSMASSLDPVLVMCVVATSTGACGSDRPEPSASTSDTGESTGTSSEDDFAPFSIDGHQWHFVVDDAQRMAMDRAADEPGDDQYPPAGGGTYADDLIVTPVDGAARHYGKMALRSIGESSRRDWNHLPNLRVTTDRFTPGLRLGGFEHLRLNNGQVGGIFRELVALRTWARLGYPAPSTAFAWVSSSVWGDDVRVPYTLVEVYKHHFCDRMFDGGCANIWEFRGEPNELVGQCQSGECDDTRLIEFANALQFAPAGAGFAQQLAAYVDWAAYREFQCLSWLTATGDDYVHNANNVVLVERHDGLFSFLPYSTDISGGQSWYPDVGLLGMTLLPRGCQLDPACWSELLATCDDVLTRWEAIAPETIVDDAYLALQRLDMLRDGDEQRYRTLRDWYAARAQFVRADPIWRAVPCQRDADCNAAPDGKTRCDWNTNLCAKPCVTHDDCPDDSYCDPFMALCVVGEPPDDYGDRWSPTWFPTPAWVSMAIGPADEDCIVIDVPADATSVVATTSAADCSDPAVSDTLLSLFDGGGNLVLANDNPTPDNYCAALEANLGMPAVVVCVRAAQPDAELKVDLSVETY